MNSLGAPARFGTELVPIETFKIQKAKERVLPTAAEASWKQPSTISRSHWRLLPPWH